MFPTNTDAQGNSAMMELSESALKQNKNDMWEKSMTRKHVISVLSSPLDAILREHERLTTPDFNTKSRPVALLMVRFNSTDVTTHLQNQRRKVLPFVASSSKLCFLHY